MQLEAFLHKIKKYPSQIEFEDTMAIIDASYSYIPTAFRNANLSNKAGENEGSCKIFAFAKIHKLSKLETLACFGKYYREDVLNNPNTQTHQNIRQFIKNGWENIDFSGEALIPK